MFGCFTNTSVIEPITDWSRIARECVYAPTSTVHVFKSMDEFNESPSRYMSKGDIIVIKNETGYRNEGIYLCDDRGICNIEAYPDDYGTIPPWGADLPITYFSIPSKHVSASYGVIDHNSYAPVANTHEDCVKWFGAIKKMVQNKHEYCIVDDRFLVINNYEEGLDLESPVGDTMYLTQNSYLFHNIIREKMPEHGIIHESNLCASEREIELRKKTGIPVHQMYYLDGFCMF